MDARPIDLTKLFEPTTQYHAPLFQRPYVWTLEKQWEPLWQDIRTAAERQTDASAANDDQPHFLGAIVLELREAREVTTKSIIDGQQRMTSLQLVIAAARTAAEEAGEENLARALNALLFFEDWLVEDATQQFKLVPTNADRVAFRLAARHNVTDLKRVPPGDSTRTMEAYRYFRGALDEWLTEIDEVSRGDKLRALVAALRQKVRVVVIDIGRDENAQAIFETMNARGTPLLAADLVKNYLFQGADESRAEYLYSKYWAEFDTRGWRREVGSGRSLRPRIDQLLGNWLILHGEDDLHWQELFLDFKRYRSTTDASAEDLLADLREVANVYDLMERFPTTTAEGLFMYRLDILEARTAIPLAIRMFGAGGIEDPQDRVRALLAVESWLVRRMLCRLTTKNYNQVVRSLLTQLSGGSFTSAAVVDFLSGLGGESQLWPDDARLLANLRTQPYYTAVTRPRLRMVLEAIEAELHRPMNVPFNDWGKLTIEHVLPQEWSYNWPLPAGRPELEARIERDALKHRLGNLTLVAQPLNSKLSNAPWTAEESQPQKREALRAHNVYMLNKPLVEEEAWDENDIQSRGEALAELVLRIWPSAEAFGGKAIITAAPGTPEPPRPVEDAVFLDADGRPMRLWDQHQALAALDAVEPQLGEVGRAVMEWVERWPDMTYVKAQRVPEIKPAVVVNDEPLTLFTISNEAEVFLALDTWRRIPELNADEDWWAYRDQINGEIGSSMKQWRNWPHFPASLLYDETVRRKFFTLMEQLAQRLRSTDLVPTSESAPAQAIASSTSAAVGELAQRYQEFLMDVASRYSVLDPTFESPQVGPRNWLPFGAGRTGFSFVWSIAGGSRLRVELYIDVGDRNTNKGLFDRLRAHAGRIEAAFGEALSWERLDDRKACRVATYFDTDPATFDIDPVFAERAAETMARFIAAMKPAMADL
jgi:hypothetical protein